MLTSLTNRRGHAGSRENGLRTEQPGESVGFGVWKWANSSSSPELPTGSRGRPFRPTVPPQPGLHRSTGVGSLLEPCLPPGNTANSGIHAGLQSKLLVAIPFYYIPEFSAAYFICARS
ncbi:hypothetical protein DPEC_G00020440 [Dallia pectoralis]|uniref:Uncharacterized protein n=1 Tax=Dallia pectoralis TaxID=75939 RepID=A0ACC2HGK6_DALPE|nr:hypothetical protein DPEC_G00020440 [Dallia pectoralis]